VNQMKLSTLRQGRDQRQRALPLPAHGSAETINESMRTTLLLAMPTQIRYSKFLRVQQRDRPLDPVQSWGSRLLNRRYLNKRFAIGSAPTGIPRLCTTSTLEDR
jgi:hypothetical protein